MFVKPNPMTVNDYAEAMIGGRIKVNRDYQRSGGLWPYRAKCALIETMILGYPMPALFMHQQFDLETRKPFREVVDGQQRTDAIMAFYNKELMLSKKLATERLRGKKLTSLNPEDYEAFITYSLPIFLFTDATSSDVSEAFRRINSHTSVLNPEEKRHSRFQGTMKWFIVDLTKELYQTFCNLNVFSKSQLLRMQDAKLLTEILFAYYRGIATTKDEQLDALYADFDSDDEMENADELRDRILTAFGEIGTWNWLPGSSFVKPYQLLTLVLAVMHAQTDIESLTRLAAGGQGLVAASDVQENMSVLEQALEASEQLPSNSTEPVEELEVPDGADNADRVTEFDPRFQAFSGFITASRGATNTQESRRERFLTMLRAVTSTSKGLA